MTTFNTLRKNKMNKLCSFQFNFLFYLHFIYYVMFTVSKINLRLLLILMLAVFHVQDLL